jgi:hypothetical protein
VGYSALRLRYRVFLLLHPVWYACKYMIWLKNVVSTNTCGACIFAKSIFNSEAICLRLFRTISTAGSPLLAIHLANPDADNVCRSSAAHNVDPLRERANYDDTPAECGSNFSKSRNRVARTRTVPLERRI